MNTRRSRAALTASILVSCFVALASSAGCSSCAGDDDKSPQRNAPVNGSGGPGSKPPLERRPTMRLNPAFAIDAAGNAPAPAPSSTGTP